MGEHESAKVFTTGQVAEICQVAPRTVSKWFDSGRLRGYRIPGSRDRRIPREALRSFLRENGMPLGDLQETGILRVLVIAADQLTAEGIVTPLRPEGFDLRAAASAFEAGSLAAQFQPHAVIVDSSVGPSTLNGIATLLKANPHHECFLIAILPRGEELPAVAEDLFNDCFHAPFDPALLAARIQSRANTTQRQPPRKG